MSDLAAPITIQALDNKKEAVDQPYPSLETLPVPDNNSGEEKDKAEKKAEKEQAKAEEKAEKEQAKAEKKAEKEKDKAEKEKKFEDKKIFITKDGARIKSPPDNGLYILHYENGYIEVTYKYGKKNGPSKTYNKDKQILFMVNYVNNKLEGPAAQYYSNGKEETIFVYKEGVMTGPMRGFYSSGVRRTDGNLVKGQLEGQFIFYDMYGDVCQQSDYSKGLLHGPSTTFFPKAQGGGICQISHYENGLLVQTQEMYYTTGEVLQRTPYDKGRALEYPVNYDQKGNAIRDRGA